VIELDAYASVADLIHAAISANGGAATLKEVSKLPRHPFYGDCILSTIPVIDHVIPTPHMPVLVNVLQIYEVCDRNGRIAYRRADGSRLITTNDHWKSQVRHALYTGGRFERVPGNGEFWQLSQPFRETTAEIVKVLVRTDDPTCNVRASLSLPSSTGKPPASESLAVPSSRRQRRKRAMAGGPLDPGTTASLEAGICDSVNHDFTSGLGRQRDASARRQRAKAVEAFGPPDNHSTQDEAGDEVNELPTLRRGSRRTSWKKSSTPYLGASSDGYVGTLPLQDEQLSSGMRSAEMIRDSTDPSNLRWGSTGLRSTIIIAADSSMSAGRTPVVPPSAAAKARAGSAEADSNPLHSWLARGPWEPRPCDPVGPPLKRQAKQTPGCAAAVQTPNVPQDFAAHMTPPFMAQWAQALQHMHEVALAQQDAKVQEAQQHSTYPPMAMLPSYLPGLLAAAAPFMGSQQVQQELHKQMEAVFLGNRTEHEQSGPRNEAKQDVEAVPVEDGSVVQ